MFSSNIVVLSSGFNDVFRVIIILIIFVAMLFAAYYTSRFVGGVGMKRSMNASLQIIEVLPVGPQKTLQLIRVGDQYYLIGVTKDRIVYLTEIENGSLDLESMTKKQDESFKNVFNDFIKKNKN